MFRRSFLVRDKNKWDKNDDKKQNKPSKVKKQKIKLLREKEYDEEVNYYLNGLKFMNERTWGDYE